MIKFESEVTPSLIVFDLDYTLWPFWVDTHYTPPFIKRTDGTIIDAQNRSVNPYQESTSILKSLVDNGICLGVASRTSEVEGAQQLIDLFNWKQYFEFIEIFPGRKVTHFERIRDSSGIDLKDMLFFDDENRNIRDVEKMGVVSYFVKSGINTDVIQQGIKKFQDSRKIVDVIPVVQ